MLMFSLTGPGHKYEDGDDLDEACQFGNSYVSAHFGSTCPYTANTIPFYTSQ